MPALTALEEQYHVNPYGRGRDPRTDWLPSLAVTIPLYAGGAASALLLLKEAWNSLT